MLRSVDFPQPDGPIKATNSPDLISRLIPLSTSSLLRPEPNPLWRPDTLSICRFGVNQYV